MRLLHRKMPAMPTLSAVNNSMRHGSNDNSISDSGSGTGTNSIEISLDEDTNTVSSSPKATRRNDFSPAPLGDGNWPVSFLNRFNSTTPVLMTEDVSNEEHTTRSRGSTSRDDSINLPSIGNGIEDNGPVSNGLWQEIRINSAEADALSKYNDFETIDWVRDLRRDRERHYALKRNKYSYRNSTNGRKFTFSWLCSWITFRKRDCFKYYYDAASAWFCLLLVALLAALAAGFIDIAATWLTNLTTGLCWPEFWFNREQCCWSSSEAVVTFRSINASATRCPHWYPWSELIFSKSEQSAVGGSLLLYISFVLCSVLVAALAAQLVHTFAPYASGSGISEIKTILSGFVVRNYLGGTTLIVKSVTLVLAVASGLVLGKEGPLVHVACCCGNVVTRLFPKFGNNEAKKREILSAAAAVGVAVAFGAPLGGVLFSLEEVSYYFPLETLWRSFFCALSGALVLRAINPFGNARLVIFYIDYHAPWRVFELIPFVFIGILGGCLGALFIKANYAWCRYRKESSLGRWPRTEVVVVTLLTALVSFHNPYTRASLSSVIERLYQRCSPADDGADGLCDYVSEHNNRTVYIGTGRAGPGVQTAVWQLTVALVVKLVLWVFTVGMKIPTGLFIPSLAIGAILGRIVGIAVEQIAYAGCMGIEAGSAAACSTVSVQPGLYAMLGSAAVMAGVTRMTVTLVVMMLEVTGGLEYIVPLMVAVIVAKWVGDACEHMSIYDVHIELNTYPYLDHKNYAEDMVLSNALLDNDIVATDVMSPPLGGVIKRDINSKRRSPAIGAGGDENFYPALSPALFVVTQDSMTVAELDELCRSQAQREPHGVRGFPVVFSRTSPYLTGYVCRKELQFALAKLKRSATTGYDGDYAAQTLLGATPVYFTYNANTMPSQQRRGVAAVNSRVEVPVIKPVQLTSIVDFAPVTVTSRQTIEIIIDLFRKLGLRHVLVTNNGKVLGIVTKKDVVRFLKRRSGVKTRVLVEDSNNMPTANGDANHGRDSSSWSVENAPSPVGFVNGMGNRASH